MHTVTDPSELPDEQVQLVAAAAEDRGRLRVCVKADTKGRAVRSKHERFFDPDDRTVAAHYIDLLIELERLLLFRQAGGRETYELTNFGWLVSRKLKENTDNTERRPT